MFNMIYFLQVVLPASIAIVIGVVVERVLASLVSRFGKIKDLHLSHIHLFLHHCAPITGWLGVGSMPNSSQKSGVEEALWR